ncbi:MAG: hypothetical protein NUV84_00370 [Candidatus Uhrbacteria bacterium]|nr:hypothetical protein [Candidatus Uhrbacteria bacterium]
MPKSKKTENKFSAAEYVSKEGSIMDWAHEGTKEAVEKLERFIESTLDDDARIMAKIALDEARFNYLCANNAQEERDLELAFLIVEKEERRFTLQEKSDAAEHELAVLEIEKDVHDALIANANKVRKEEWKHHFSEDYRMTVVMCRDELLNESLYLDAWIAQAGKLIKTEKYKNLPQGAFDGWHRFSEGVSFWANDDDDVCPDCGSDHNDDV